MKEYKETDRKKNAWREIEGKLGYEEGKGMFMYLYSLFS